MEADGAPSTPPPLPLSVLRFTGIQSYSYTDQRKVEADVEVTEDRTGDLSLRKPRTSQLSHDCSYYARSIMHASRILHVLHAFVQTVYRRSRSTFMTSTARQQQFLENVSTWKKK